MQRRGHRVYARARAASCGRACRACITLVRAVEGSGGLVDDDARTNRSDGGVWVAVDGDGIVLGLEVGEATLVKAVEDDGAMVAGCTGSSRLGGRDRVGSDVEPVQRHALCG